MLGFTPDNPDDGDFSVWRNKEQDIIINFFDRSVYYDLMHFSNNDDMSDLLDEVKRKWNSSNH